jgi:1,2-diacylglycerol 3-beta-glucosyltransferase
MDVVATALAVIVGLPSVYLAFLAALTLLPAPRPPRGAWRAGELRFAVLVPAHDEESGIGRTVTNLFRLDYPRDRFSVHVVADNCGDATAAEARRNGACVHERISATEPGKGAALNWLMEKVAYEEPGADGFVVVDADSELSPNFLVAMERRLRDGAAAVQALNLVAVSVDRPLVRVRELAFHLGCHLRPLAYARLGASCALFGNGMCFTPTFCRRYRWSQSAVVEDGELYLRLVRDGLRVALAHEAAVRSVMPENFRDARSQALRWERGRFDYFRAAVGLTWRGAVSGNRAQLIAGLSVLIPPFTVLAAMGIVMIVAAAILGSPLTLAIAVVSLLSLVFYVLRGAALGGLKARTVLRIALWAPPYTAWKLWVIGLAAFGAGRGKWSRTTRSA